MTTTDEKTRCTISGRVQGVCFRAATQEQAVRLGVTGYARNLRDGRVEVLACGPPEAVAQLREWLHQGPPAASVTAVHCEPADDPAPADFTIR
ncbi:acylphosphatase [Halorhodospira halophila]|uniref:acylphosphatase n=1 Tax=Halorhodospira halophila TaxID=1053 RepID=UPI001911AF78|nr:acylphosphatase [Halorhodospira halophila]MBK5936104.1 acylphosphatase [Halorhodospira halophila]